VVEVNQSIWDYVNVEPRVRHATWRLDQAVTQAIEGRRRDCARGAETGRLAATLLQKEATEMLRGAEIVLEALEFPATYWRSAVGASRTAVDEAASELDPNWRAKQRARWAARPADLNL